MIARLVWSCAVVVAALLISASGPATAQICGPTTHFSIDVPTFVTAGSAFSFTVTARDACENVVSGYGGTVHFTTTDGAGSVPADYTFTGADAGVKTFTSGATFASAGAQTLTATDSGDPAVTGTSPKVFVRDPAATIFVFHLAGDQEVPPVATGARGGCFGQLNQGTGRLALTCVHNVTGATLMHIHQGAPGVNGPVVFDLGDPTSPVDAAWAGMTAADVANLLAGDFYLDIHTTTHPAGKVRGQILSRTVDTVAFTADGTQVVPPTPTTATASCIADLDNAATALAINCTHNVPGPTDAHVHEAPGRQNGPVVFTFPSPASPMAANVPMSTGRLIADFAAGFLYVDIHGPADEIRGQIGPLPPPATGLTVTAPGTAAAGTPFSVTVTAVDQFNDVVPGYMGTVHFTKTDAGVGSAVPADYTFVAGDNGMHTFTGGVTLVTPGNQTVTATDTGNPSITGTSSAIAVSPGAATHFTVTAPATATAGTPFNVTVTARDQFNNVVTGYTGTVHFTKTDAGAGSGVPTDYTFVAGDNGVHTFTGGVTLVTSGNQTVTATDTGNPSITGTSNNVNVSAAAATHFSLATPATATAGTPFTFTVTARDQFNNAATGYTGTVHFTKTDSGAGSVVPADYTFTAGDNGVHTFTTGATFVTAGNQRVTATDSVTPSITGTSNNVNVGASATTTHFAVTAPATATAGTPFTFTVTALDQFNNTAAGYTGTVHFTKTDSGAGSVVPADYTFTAGDSGVHTFTNGVIFVTSGNQTVTATDTGNATISGTSNVIAVSAGVATHFSLNAPAVASPGAGGIRAAGTPFTFTVTALDQFDNVAVGYAGTIHSTSTDPLATLPADSPLTNGTGTFTATLRTAGSQTIKATDTVNSAITGTSNAIVVAPAAATHFAISAPTTVAGGIPFSFTVTALDQFNNVATGYAGTVHFTSSDPAATLPPDSPLTNGVGTFAATFRSPGAQTLTATDTANPSITGTATINGSAAPIPTLGTWAFLLLTLLLAATALRALRSRSAA